MAGARTPERVYDKVRECRFFIARMADYEHDHRNPDHFLHCVSAFLSAFRALRYRLYGVTRLQRGKSAQVALRNQLDVHPQIGFLLSISNAEMHEDGARVLQRFTVDLGDSIPRRWSSRWSQIEERWSSQFKDRFPVQTSVTVKDWQFEGNQSNLIVLCNDALDAMETFVRQNIRPAP